MDCDDFSFLINFYLKGREKYIVKSTFWNKCKSCINNFITETPLFIAQTEKNHWVCINIVSKNLYYFDWCKKNVPQDIKDFAEVNNLSWVFRTKVDCSNYVYTHLLFIHRQIVDYVDCSKVSLFFTLQLLNSKIDIVEIVKDKKNLNKFIEDFDSCKSQLEKVKQKIKVCSDLFSSILNEKEMPSITDYKQALYFTYFVESLALQDKALFNEELKLYIIQIIGYLNVELIKDIRSWLLHREHCSYIFPQQLHKFTFKQKNSRKIFQCLQTYLEYVHKKLCGEEINKPEEQPGFMIFHDDNLGNKVEESDAAFLVEDLTFKFIKEKFLSGKTENPEKILFDFLLNFIPLLQFLYKKVLKPGNSLLELIDIRNQMIHNFFSFYEKDETAPYLAFQVKLRDVKEILLKINFCSKISRDLGSYLEPKERLNKSLENFRTLFSEELNPQTIDDKSLEKFKTLFSEKLNPQTIDGSVENKAAYDHVKKEIDRYFQSLFIIDSFFNEIKIENVTIKNFELPKIYYRFSTEKRKSILEQFTALEEIQISSISEKYRQMLKDNLRNKLEVDYGMTESEIDFIFKFGVKAKEYDKRQLTKEILKHLSNIMKLNEKNSKFNLQYYYEYIENKPSIHVTRSIKKLKLKKFRERIFKIKINNAKYEVKLSTILKNFISVFFNIYPNSSTIYENLESVFQDSVVIELLSCRMPDLNKIKSQITGLSFLVPLGVELLCNGKLKLEIKEERDFILYLTETLLDLETVKEYLTDLLSFKLKDKSFKFPEDCLKLIVEKDLINTRPDKVYFLFSIPDIQRKLINLPRNELFESLFVSFLRFQYKLSLKVYRKKNYEEALALVDGKPAGLSLVVKEVLHRNIFQKKITFESRFLIAIIKYEIGIRNYTKIGDEERERKHLNDSLKILEALLSDVSNATCEDSRICWELRVNLLSAHIFHRLGRFKESWVYYREIFLKLYTICDKENINEELFNEYGFFVFKVSPLNVANKIKVIQMSEKYKSATKVNFKGLNLYIPQILGYYARELLCLMRSNEEEISLRGKQALNSFEYIYQIQNQLLQKQNFIIKQTNRYLYEFRRKLNARYCEPQTASDKDHLQENF